MTRSGEAAAGADAPRRRVEEAFRRRWGHPPAVVVRAPGRLNLIGAHVDHQEGWVLPGAIDRAIWLAATPRRDRALLLQALDLDDETGLALDDLPPPGAAGPDDWWGYPAGVARELAALGETLPGLAASFGGDLPRGAGMSSSAALEVAFLLAWEALGGPRLTTREKAALGRQVENDYLGVGSGIMDQMASLLGRRDHLLLIDCRTLAVREVPLPAGCALLVLDSGVRRRLSDSGFSDRSAECRRALGLLRAPLPHLETLRDLTPGELERHAGDLPEPLPRRVRHVVEECRRTQRCAELLAAGDPAAAGALVTASHASSRDLYEVSVPELDLLVAAATAAPGCHGARLSGGGFGGCVAALVAADAADAVARAAAGAFREEFGRRPPTFVARVDDGASVV